MRKALYLATSTGLAALVWAGSVQAETLQEAIEAAYQYNPTILQQRAQLKALEETVVQADAGYRPTVSLNGTSTYTQTNFGANQSTNRNSQAAINLNQPLYEAGRTKAAVRAAEAQVAAARETLRASEEQVFLKVATAYLDVWRDEQVLSTRRRDVSVLKNSVAEVTAKFEVGALTKTDVATVRTQFLLAKAALAAQTGQLKVSRAEYIDVVGHIPVNLKPVPVIPGLPTDFDKALDLAEKSNPSLLAANLTEQVSRAKIAAAKAARGPQVAATAQYGLSGSAYPFKGGYDREWQVELTVTQPLYAGGQINSGIREAVENNRADRFAIDQTSRDTVQAVAQSFASMLSGKDTVAQAAEESEVAKQAFDGVSEEFHAGLRTTLDIVAAEQALSNAEVTLAGARHDEYLAEIALLSATGTLDPKAFGSTPQVIDTAAHLKKIRRQASLPDDPIMKLLEGINLSGPLPKVGEKSQLAPGSLRVLGAGANADASSIDSH